MGQFLILLGFLFFSVVGLADDQDLVHDAALSTRRDMKDPKAREALINHDSASKQADHNAQSVVGKTNMDEMYGITADLVPTLYKDKTPEQVAEILKKAQANPEEFLKSLPPDIQKRIRDLAGKSNQEPDPKAKP